MFICPPPADLYCTLEVDSFGYFVSKAKTRVFRDTTEPKWDEVSGEGLRHPAVVTKHTCLPDRSCSACPACWPSVGFREIQDLVSCSALSRMCFSGWGLLWELQKARICSTACAGATPARSQVSQLHKL